MTELPGLFCVIPPSHYGDNLEEWQAHLEWARSLPDEEKLKAGLIEDAELLSGSRVSIGTRAGC
jgi:hypothetical protein